MPVQARQVEECGSRRARDAKAEVGAEGTSPDSKVDKEKEGMGMALRYRWVDKEMERKP